MGLLPPCPTLPERGILDCTIYFCCGSRTPRDHLATNTEGRNAVMPFWDRPPIGLVLSEPNKRRRGTSWTVAQFPVLRVLPLPIPPWTFCRRSSGCSCGKWGRSASASSGRGRVGTGRDRDRRSAARFRLTRGAGWDSYGSVDPRTLRRRGDRCGRVDALGPVADMGFGCGCSASGRFRHTGALGFVPTAVRRDDRDRGAIWAVLPRRRPRSTGYRFVNALVLFHFSGIFLATTSPNPTPWLTAAGVHAHL